MHPDIGVIIVNWNTFDMLERCLDALSKQDTQIHRIIVLDNYSDNRPEHLDCCLPVNTKYIRLDSNVGFARANNIGATELHDCKWIALVNADAFLDTNCLSRLVSTAERHPQAAGFGALTVMDRDPRLLDGAGDVYHFSGLCWREGYGCSNNNLSLEERVIFSPCAAVALYRRDAFESVGGLDEDFFCYCEDVDLGFRLLLAGHQCMLVPKARATHVGGASSGGSKSDFAIYHGHRNLVWTFVKNMPTPLFWPLVPIHLMMNILAVLIYALKGKGKIVLHAKIDAIRGLPRIWGKRRKIQSGRVASTLTVWRMLSKKILFLP